MGLDYAKNKMKQNNKVKNPFFDPTWFSNLSPFNLLFKARLFRVLQRSPHLHFLSSHVLLNPLQTFSVDYYTKINELLTSDFSGYISVTVLWALQAFHRVYFSLHFLPFTSLTLFFPVFLLLLGLLCKV